MKRHHPGSASTPTASPTSQSRRQRRARAPPPLGSTEAERATRGANAAGEESAPAGKKSRKAGPVETSLEFQQTDFFIPSLVGTAVPGDRPRQAGPYILGPKMGASPVRSVVQCLARRGNKFYHLKMLMLSNSRNEATASQDERHGKVLMHNEHSLLSLLTGERGVIQMRDFFSEWCLHEEDLGGGKFVYNGTRSKRICLVMDCVVPSDFTMRGSAAGTGGGGGGGTDRVESCPPNGPAHEAIKYNVNLQHFVIREKRLGERSALEVFYNIVKVVHRLHERDIVHRDLKLGNIILNTRSKDVVLTNFCLGKHLMGDFDLLKDQRGSPAYISPDVLNGKPYQGKPSDMWALGVVLFTMLYGQFPFYDAVPQELFAKIRAARYTIPNDVRVSEDTKNIIRRLLLVNPTERLSAGALKVVLEELILAWKNMVCPAPEKGLQVVPTYNPAAAAVATTANASSKKEEAEAEAKKPPGSSGFRDRLLLSQLHSTTHAFRPTGIDYSQAGQPSGCELVDDRPNPFGRMPVTRVEEDVRALSAEEYRMFGPLIDRLRQNPSSVNSTSSTGQPLPSSTCTTSGHVAHESSSHSSSLSSDQSVTAAAAVGPAAMSAAAAAGSGGSISGTDSHLLISANSPLMARIQQRMARRREEMRLSMALPAPTRAEPEVEQVPVIEQEAVLDLSSGRRRQRRPQYATVAVVAPPSPSTTSASAATSGSRQNPSRMRDRSTMTPSIASVGLPSPQPQQHSSATIQTLRSGRTRQSSAPSPSSSRRRRPQNLPPPSSASLLSPSLQIQQHQPPPVVASEVVLDAVGDAVQEPQTGGTTGTTPSQGRPSGGDGQPEAQGRT